MDYIYERSRLPIGVKLETVTGGRRYKGKVWTEIARQIYCENGKDGFREMGHFPSGAPFLYGDNERISISHTEGCYAVATIKVNAEDNLAEFSRDTAVGIDVEKADREQAQKLRARFLTEEEEKIVSPDSVEENVIAWTCKEAMLKAGMNPEINWRSDIIITALPSIDKEGSGYINLHGERYDFRLYTLQLEEFLITIAY